MKTSELTGADLALWVARSDKHRCEGLIFERRQGCMVGVGDIGDERSGPEIVVCIAISPGGFKEAIKIRARFPGVEVFAPHEDWAQGGPLIEKHQITLAWQPMKGEWMAGTTSATMLEFRWLGFHASPLIAAMRALVASVYGDSVPDEPAP